MFISRDITHELQNSKALIQILLGPRQCGKSTLFASLSPNHSDFQEVSFDDLKLRQLANRDPALFLEQFTPPLILDEVQYAPNLFSELKKQIDLLKRAHTLEGKTIPDSTLFRLTGSNQILMDKNIHESLAGRASYYYLNTLTVHEIKKALPETSIKEILFKGGWPELYTNLSLSTTNYLNDYIRSYIEKDIVLSAGIQKLSEFNTFLGLLAARTAQLTDYTSIGNDSGIKSTTVKEWISLLERADLTYSLKPYFNNLNKRLIKSPKLYFLDTGLAVRLQGWSDYLPLFNSPQMGSLFETLALAEIVKFIRNYRKDWQLYFWRTKDGEEIDFIIKTTDQVHAFEVKLSMQNLPQTLAYPPTFLKEFKPKTPLVIITFGGQRLKLSDQCLTLGIDQLHDYLLEI